MCAKATMRLQGSLSVRGVLVPGHQHVKMSKPARYTIAQYLHTICVPSSVELTPILITYYTQCHISDPENSLPGLLRGG